MRQILIVLLLLISQTSFGQLKLDGKYCCSYSNVLGYCLTFHSDSIFEYSSWSCFDRIKGNGIYKLKKNNLILNFISDDTLKNSFEIKQMNCITADSITLNFLVLDKETNETFPFAYIWMTGATNDTLRTNANIEGIAKIRVKKSTSKIEIIVSYPDYKRFSFIVNTDNCQDIAVYMVSKHNRVENGTKWEYDVIKFDNSSMTLREDKWDILFTKVRK